MEVAISLLLLMRREGNISKWYSEVIWRSYGSRIFAVTVILVEYDIISIRIVIWKFVDGGVVIESTVAFAVAVAVAFAVDEIGEYSNYDSEMMWRSYRTRIFVEAILLVEHDGICITIVHRYGGGCVGMMICLMMMVMLLIMMIFFLLLFPNPSFLSFHSIDYYIDLVWGPHPSRTCSTHYPYLGTQSSLFVLFNKFNNWFLVLFPKIKY